ncbi:ParB/RepB/Spo0J family partition protein [Paenibacillus sp. NPDC057967]|uniref:ParB/RepB/Spo0J family partition protein n=1 Tax=Paenibacillus sp. NPDC057967 TaxID=3346293 RepID=UPI0036DA36C6
MNNLVPTERLCPHPRNDFYFSELPPERYADIKRSIETDGIRDPLKVTLDLMILAGHQRYHIAQDLGLANVPVVMVDVTGDDAEYQLIADNTERRGEAETDPIRKARIAAFLRDYWGIKRGGDRAKGQNVPLKTIDDIAGEIGESGRATKRILKLNDLIPPLQALVSSGELGPLAEGSVSLSLVNPDCTRCYLRCNRRWHAESARDELTNVSNGWRSSGDG